MIYSSVWDETNPFTYKNQGVCPVKDVKLGSFCVACAWSTTWLLPVAGLVLVIV